MDDQRDDYLKGIALLSAAKRVMAIAKKLDTWEAEPLRRAADGLTERGLGLVVQGARELSSALKQAQAAAARQGVGQDVSGS